MDKRKLVSASSSQNANSTRHCLHWTSPQFVAEVFAFFRKVVHSTIFTINHAL